MKIRYTVYWLLVCSVLLAQKTLPISSNDYRITATHFDIENQLSGKFFNYVFKDRRGLIWIGSQHGLYRYDGHNFELFDVETGLPFNQIREIHEDAEGYLWLFRYCSTNPQYCEQPLAFFHSITKKVVTVQERFGKALPIDFTKVNSIHSNKTGTTFCLRTETQTYQWTIDKGFSVMPPNALDTVPKVITVLGKEHFGAYYQDNQSFIYYGLDANGKIIYQQQLSNDSLLPNRFFTYYVNMDKLPDADQYPPSPIRSINIRNTIHYSNGQQNILYTIDENGKIEENPQLLSYVSHNATFAKNTLYDATQNTLWSARRDGIQVMQFDQKRLINILINKSSMTFLVGELRKEQYYAVVNSAKATQLWYFDEQGSHSLQKKGSTKQLPNFSDLPTGNLEELQYATKIQKMGLFGLVYHINGQPKRIKETNLKEKGINGYPFIMDDEIWFVRKKIQRYNPKTQEVYSFDQTNGFELFGKTQIYAVLHLEGDKYALGTKNGLFIVSKSEGVLGHFNNQQENTHYLPITSYVAHLTKTADGLIWLATANGLIKWTGLTGKILENGKTYQQYTKKDGLSHNSCISIYPDKYDFLWIATENGLVQMERKSERMKIYNSKNGLKVTYFMERSHCETSTGKLLFGGVGGAVLIDPEKFKDVTFDEPAIPLMVVAFNQYNQKTKKFEKKTQELLTKETITLTPKGRIFTLRVALKDYRGREGHQFAHRIPGYIDGWQLGKSNVISISGLPYGKHLLQVKGRLEDGRYSSEMLEIPIRVLRPVFLRWWFLLLMIVLLGSSSYYAYQWRIRRLKNRQKELELAVKERTKQIEKDKQVIEAQAEELRNLDEVKSRFFANVSHELRTPLTLMLAPIESSIKRNQMPNRDYTNLLMAQRNGRQLNKMINEILDLTKLEAGKMQLQLEKVVWYIFLRSIIANFESLANRKEIDFQFSYQGNEALQVKLDKKKIETIIVNLLSNAFKFTNKNGKVLVTTNTKGEYLTVLISDTGRGIHPDDLPNIFNRFYQTKRKKTVAEGGTGIGLAISKEFLELMEGTLTAKNNVDSAWQGQGATFTLQIPKTEVIGQVSTEDALLIKNTAFPTVEKEIETLDIRTKEKTVTILLVEDNLDLRGFVSSLLQSKYKVLTAENGKEALEKLEIAKEKNQNLHLIISDVMMPIMDGYQLLEILKTNNNYRPIPVIMLTARGGMDDKLKALRIGVDDYMLKPFHEEELFVRIENLLRNAANRKENIEELIEEKQFPTSLKKSSKNRENSKKELTVVSSQDLVWLAEVEKYIKNNLVKTNFTVEQVAQEMGISPRHLSRKLKQLVGLTPRQYIKVLRYAKARELLENRTYSSVKAVAFSVGFKDVANFSRQFKKQFGKLPSAYLD